MMSAEPALNPNESLNESLQQERDHHDRCRTALAALVDEAQDLSPMECRAIARRAAFGSLTILGDLAQGTTPWAARTWDTTLRHLGKPDAAVIPLTIGFRVPQAVVELANRLLERLDV